MIKIRSGIGYDIHRLIAGNGLMLGGVKVSGSLRAEAHSDGDVLIHSLIDALLGAMGATRYRRTVSRQRPGLQGHRRSLQLLRRVKEILDNGNFEIMNIDCVVVIEAPKISPFQRRDQKKYRRHPGHSPSRFQPERQNQGKNRCRGQGRGHRMLQHRHDTQEVKAVGSGYYDPRHYQSR